MDEPILTDYPHDRLSSIAAAMSYAAGKMANDIRGIIFIEDKNGGCEHTFGYPEHVPGVPGRVFVDAATHILELGKGLGIDVRLLINGQSWPPAE